MNNECKNCGNELSETQIKRGNKTCSKSCKMILQQKSRTPEEKINQKIKELQTKNSWDIERKQKWKDKISKSLKNIDIEEKERRSKCNSESQRNRHLKNHFKNPEDFTEEKIKTLFVKDGFFYINDFREHFGIGHSSAYDIKYEFGITCPNYSDLKTCPGFSKKEKELVETLKSRYPEFDFVWQERLNRQIFFRKDKKRIAMECDILVFKNTTLLFGIEYNGKYYHSEKFPEKLKNDEIKKEQSKWIPGFKLVCVDENEEDKFYGEFDNLINQNYINKLNL